MRILLSKDSRKELFNHLINKNKCSSLKELSIKLNIPFKTLNNWVYGDHFLPENIIPLEIISSLDILKRQEDNWGRVKGGRKAYKLVKSKYGLTEIKRRQSLGGMSSLKNLNRKPKKINVDINNSSFLEFYGALLGDGWLSKIKIKNKPNFLWIIGISGHQTLDKEYHIYIQGIIISLFNRQGYLKERPKYHARELLLGYRSLVEFLNKELNFPIGKKIDLKIPNNLLDFKYSKFIIRGIFDTDGSFYFDKTPAGNSYPIISICMKQPVLIKQINNILTREGFKPQASHKGLEIKLKGSIQLKKWMDLIGSSNPKHLNKMLPWRNLDSAEAS